MKLPLARLAGFATLVLVSGWAVGGEAGEAKDPRPAPASMTVEQINACTRANLAERGSLRDLTLSTRARDGKDRSLKLKLFWKPSKTADARLNLRVVEPAELAGSSYLLRETPTGEELYVYLPAADKVQRVGGDGFSRPLWGTDLSYLDFKQLHGLAAAGNTERTADAKVSGRPVFVLRTQLKEPTPQYATAVSYVDQQSCVLLKSEFLDPAGKPVKRLEADAATLSSLDPYWFVTRYRVQDLVRGTQTQVELSDIYLLEYLYEKNFDPLSFYLSNE